MFDCPVCDDSFNSRHSLRVHHSNAHGERLPNRECRHCGAEYYSEHEKKYCSDECRETAVSFEGENNPNYDSGMDTTGCDNCGSAFEYYPSEKSGRYCPDCVEHEQWRHERDIAGERNPRCSGGKREYECVQCGAKISRWQGQVDSENVFCSVECQYAWISDEFTGDGHPNWAGGVEANYGQGWNRARRLAIERDDHACVLCGTTKEDLGRNPDVHHLDPVRAFVETPVTVEADAHYLENLVSLFPACHRRVEFEDVDPALLRDAV